jgi:hypothetical protein
MGRIVDDAGRIGGESGVCKDGGSDVGGRSHSGGLMAGRGKDEGDSDEGSTGGCDGDRGELELCLLLLISQQLCFTQYNCMLGGDGAAVGGEGAFRGSGSGGVGAGSKEGFKVVVLLVHMC